MVVAALRPVAASCTSLLRVLLRPEAIVPRPAAHVDVALRPMMLTHAALAVVHLVVVHELVVGARFDGRNRGSGTLADLPVKVLRNLKVLLLQVLELADQHQVFLRAVRNHARACLGRRPLLR